MTVLATDVTRLSAVVKMEFEPQTQYCRESVILNDTASQVLQVGAVLGKVTATGKYKVCQTNAVDGSQTPAAIYIADTQGLSGTITTTGTDQKIIVLARGPAIVADIGLSFGAANQPSVATCKTAFAAISPPILVETGL